jgi:hypothetical protein
VAQNENGGPVILLVPDLVMNCYWYEYGGIKDKDNLNEIAQIILS